MADRIRGMTVEIGGDTTGLSKALSGVNKEIRNAQTQLKDVNKLLKLDPTNTTLLAQKQGLKNLEKEAKNTDSSIAAALKQTGSKLQEVGGKISGVGETLSKDITAPITAIGAASLAAFNEVDAGNVAAIHEARVSASEHHILERFQQA